MDRPGLRRLLADVDTGLIDVVVVYKVDRLTRSLGDFARIVEAFDARGVSFVSVTQAFNTTSSMGRLTLNVLLSFAQFEREVTGERIRDKIAQSKAKGMWMGGSPPLGYDPPGPFSDRALLVNPAEAELVNRIFRRYLELGSVHGLARELLAEGVRSKAWTTTKGRAMGGLPFSRGALFHLLKNRTYRGEILHKGQSHPGRHSAIVEQGLFDAVQSRLQDNRTAPADHLTASSRLPLTGLLFDAEGDPMSPASARSRANGKLYRYYVSAPLQQGRTRAALPGTICRVPALALDALVMDQLAPLLAGPRSGALAGWTEIHAALMRVEVHAASIEIVLSRVLVCKSVDASSLAPERDNPDQVRLTLPIRFKLRGGRTWLVLAKDGSATTRTRPDQTLIKGLRAAHQIARAAGANPDRLKLAPYARAQKSSYERNLCALAFLAPDIQAAILDGRQPYDVNLERLIKADLPLAWADQRKLLGFPAL